MFVSSVYVCVWLCVCSLACMRVNVCVSRSSLASMCEYNVFACVCFVCSSDLRRKRTLDTPTRLYYTNVFLWQVLDRSVVGDQFWFPDGWVACNQFFFV